MKVLVNGDPLKIDKQVTISELLNFLEISKVRVAVEVNREIVSRAKFESTLISEGDSVEIVKAIGGG